MTRDSSPPDAMRESGPGSNPGFRATRNSTLSPPVGPGSSKGERSTRKIPLAKPSSGRSAVTLSSRRRAASALIFPRTSTSWRNSP